MYAQKKTLEIKDIVAGIVSDGPSYTGPAIQSVVESIIEDMKEFCSEAVNPEMMDMSRFGDSMFTAKAAAIAACKSAQKEIQGLVID